MRFFALLTAATFIAVLALIPSCKPLADDPPSPDPEIAAKVVVETHDYYSEVPGSLTEAYHIHLIQYQDGSAAYSRNVIPLASAGDLVSFAVVNASPVQLPQKGYEVSFSGTGWVIPFDPTISAHVIGGPTTEIHCDCYGEGKCDVFRAVVHDNGGITFECDWMDCDEKCIGRVEQYYTKGVVIGTPSLQSF